MKEIPTRYRIMALLSPPSREVHLTAKDARWLMHYILKLEKTKPAARDSGRTHWEGCWNHRGHHACAIALIEELGGVPSSENHL